eukprot:6202896-Pleurochrysis_carterae.AAC.1
MDKYVSTGRKSRGWRGAGSRASLMVPKRGACKTDERWVWWLIRQWMEGQRVYAESETGKKEEGGRDGK